jgi:ATP-dependent helicase Lhr and Lhr-like helicase
VALPQFTAATQAWFTKSFAGPTPAQERGWPSIAAGENTLILAPTGSGKTLAAFLGAIDRLVSVPLPADEERCRVLYVSPLRALTYDVERNLRAPLTGIGLEMSAAGQAAPPVRVGVRTGDTSPAERRQIGRLPPDILITTPESLYLMLTSAQRSLLASVEQVIVDEIHSMAGAKRGVHLALSLERMERLIAQAGRPSPQRIGLSATQRPLDEIARYLGGRRRTPAGEWETRPVTVIDAGVRRQLDLTVSVPVEDMAEVGKPIMVDGQPVLEGAAAGDPEVRASIWPAVAARLVELVRAHRSTLVFVNSRRLAERLSARINEAAGEEIARAHHGSIAADQRREIEELLKAGRIPALVATSSLELGIDMGSIDLVVQVEAPATVSSGLQRIGRAGHRVGEPSKGLVIPKFRGDLLAAAVTAGRMMAGEVEHTRVPRNALDVLAQQIVAMTAVEDLSVDEVAEVVYGTYPYSDLTRSAFESVLDMLSGRYPSTDMSDLKPRINWDRVAGQVSARPGARMVAVTNGGTIPERGLYGVFTPEGGRVGELDEEMVYESRVGETFILGATTWRIEEISRDRVTVTPAPGVPGKMPFWHGDKVGRPVELGRALGRFTAEVEKMDDAVLMEGYGLDANAAANLRAYLADQRQATGGLLPTDRQLVVERFRDELGDWRVCVLSPFGARVHAPWALGIETRIRDRLGLEVQAIWSDDGIVLRLPEADEAPPVEDVLLDPDEVEELVLQAVGSSAVFAARFRENAARALLLTRRRPGSRTPLWQMRQRSADLQAVVSQYESFPILLETYRECLTDVFDIAALRQLMSDIAGRRVRVAAVEVDAPSPFASSLAFSYVAAFMYEGDAPMAERRAQALTLDRSMLAELVGSDELRELIDPLALAGLESDLQGRTGPRRARDVESLADLLRRLGDLSGPEIQARSEGGPVEALGWVAELVSTRRAAWIRVAGEERAIAVEDAGRYRDALGVAPPAGVPDAFLEPVPDALSQLLRRYARTHGPFSSGEPAARFGVPLALVEECLAGLTVQGGLSRGGFRPGGRDPEFCEVEVLRQLRQRSLAALRREVEPTAAEALARFLPQWQGVGSEARGADRCLEVVTQLQGLALPASVLERDVLADRVADYSPRLLDELISAGLVMWVGAGPLGRDDGRVMLVLRHNADLVLPRLVSGSGPEAPDGEEHGRLRDVLARRGACFFSELAPPSSLAPGQEDTVLDALWDLVWAGEVTNDTFAVVRAAVSGKVSRSRGRARPSPAGSGNRARRPQMGRLVALGPPRAQGRWSLVGRVGDPVGSVSGAGTGAAANTAASVALAEILLERYGIVTRDAVRSEGVPGGFASVYAVLKAMEESGRVRRGYFVAGLGGAQFAAPGAVDRLRSVREPERDPKARVLAATDPANPFGTVLAWPDKGPQRAAGAYVVSIGGEGCLYLEKGGRSLTALRPFDGTWEAKAVDALAGLVRDGRFPRLALARYREELEPWLRAADFVPTPRGMVRYA